jgi:hypothetical protein
MGQAPFDGVLSSGLCVARGYKVLEEQFKQRLDLGQDLMQAVIAIEQMQFAAALLKRSS